MADTYKYYPDGDRDHTSPTRHDAKFLVREGSKWRNVGSRDSWYSPEDLLKMRKNIESGFGKIRKLNEIGQIVKGGRADLLKWTEDLEGGHR